jgi:hypothetical protein
MNILFTVFALDYFTKWPFIRTVATKGIYLLNLGGCESRKYSG